MKIPVFLKLRSMDECKPAKGAMPPAKPMFKRAKPTPKKRKEVAPKPAAPVKPTQPASPFDALFGFAGKEAA